MPRPRSLFSLFAVLLLPLAAHADTCNGFSNNLVSNCGFEMGSLAAWSGTATTANVNHAGVDTGDPFTTTPTPYAGTYEAYLGSIGSTLALTQSIATTAGVNYLIEFALLNDTSPSTGYPNSFAALFGSTSIFSEASAPAGKYMLYSFTAAATSANTALSFVSRNDGGYFELDSISVVAAPVIAATPEPSSWVLLVTGIAGSVAFARRRFHGIA